jgi:phospho-N-acetylmuramoyl-pentapeptide-transferase
MAAPLAIVAAALVTAALTEVMIPVLKRFKAGQSVREDGPDSHLVKSGTPTMGGVALVAGTVVGTLCTAKVSPDLIVTLAVFAAFAALGVFDDFVKVRMKRSLGLTALQKFLLQAAIASGAALYQTRIAGVTELIIPFTGKSVDLGPLYAPFIVFVIVAMANGVNLTDGLDGLAAGVTAIAAFYFVFAGSLFCAALAGACLGFLRYNRHPARIFMGDTGSLALGGGLATAAILLRMELTLPVVGLVYVLETLSVIIQVGSYKLRKKRVFKMAPLHHHFELCGWSERNVVLSFWGLTSLLWLVSFFII